MKLFQLLGNLSKEELKNLRRAVQSPIYKPSKYIPRLYEILRSQYPNFDASQKGRQKLFAKLFPKEEYYDYKLRRLFSEMTKIIEGMLIHQNFEKDEFARKLKLTEFYKQRDLYPLFSKYTNDLLNDMENDPVINATYYRNRMDLIEATYFHPKHNKYDLKDDSLDRIMDDLDIYFMLHKVRLTLGVKANAQVMKKKYKVRFLEEIKKVKKLGFGNENILLEIYMQTIALTEEIELSDFKAYERKLFQEIERFERTDQLFIFRSALNFILKMKNKGIAPYKTIIYKWNQFGLEKNLFLVEGRLAESTFANILISGCQEKEFEWVDNFIQTYKPYLQEKNTSETIDYYYGLVYYLQGDWDKALEFLTRKANKSIFPPRQRSIIIRVLFEKFLLDESYLEVLMANLQSFETYIRRDKFFTEGRLDSFLRFVHLTRQLARRISVKETPSVIKKWFKEKKEENRPLLAKSWLTQKVENL